MVIKAIETVYNGYRFRSRLEARWAVFFDALHIRYMYEHEGFDLGELGWYLPDFWFPEFDCWGEVKPIPLLKLEFAKCKCLPQICLLLDDMPRVRHGYYCIRKCGINTYTDYISDRNYSRVLLSCSQYRHQLWWLWGEDPSDYDLDESPEIAARQARFEHGEQPKIVQR